MEIDWAQAWQTVAIGFGLVFTVLIVLALVMWLTGWLLSKIGGGTDTTEEKQGS
jgi:Na+-transporting methylmalonyl-CoA/oxaloacetate decarboxylase gamma subunit